MTDFDIVRDGDNIGIAAYDRGKIEVAVGWDEEPLGKIELEKRFYEEYIGYENVLVYTIKVDGKTVKEQVCRNGGHGARGALLMELSTSVHKRGDEV